MRSRSSGTQLFDVASPPAGAGSCSSDEDSPLSTCTSAGEVESQTDLDRVASLSVDSSSLLPVPEHLEHIWSCVTAGGGQVNPEEEQRRSNLLSLTQRVQVNRKILQHLLTNQKTQLDGSQSESREHGDAGFVTNDSNCEILQRDNNNQSLFVSARSLQQQCEDGFRMKRRCVPLRGDHNLLAPSTHTQLGVRLADGLASHPGRLSVSSGGESTRQHPSATRRLRFEDETEMEVESRYLERQWQRRQVAGQRGTSVLVSKPDLSLYINGTAKAGIRVGGCDVDRQHRRTSTGAVQRVGVQCNSCGTVLRGTVNPNLCLHTPTHQPHLNLRTEPIKETYIGSVTPGKARSSQEEGGVGHVSNMQVRRSSNQPELNGNQVPPTTDLPINPYAPTPWSAGWGSKTPSSSPIPPATLAPTSNVRLSGTKVGRVQRQEQEEQGSPAAAKLHTSHQSGAALKERNPCVVEGGSLDLRIKSSSPSSADNQAPPTSERSSDKPTRMKPQSDDPSFPEHFSNRDESSRLSLRHLFSTVRLSRTRTGSLDRLCSRTRPSASNPVPSDSNPASLLKKCPSVQSLSVGSPLLQLRKLSSVQSFGSEQKKKTGRSSVYKPAVDRFLQRCLSVEDVSSPCSSRSVGRVLQVGSDGTFLLELSQPTNRTYGFVISRGRGRRDSGVYVEDMVDSSTEKLYAGLLSVGDEILEVNGEKVACLSLDQVTHLLTQNTSATVRVLRHLRTFPQ